MSALLTSTPFSTRTAMLDASPNHQVRLDVSLGGRHEETNGHSTRDPADIVRPPPRLFYSLCPPPMTKWLLVLHSLGVSLSIAVPLVVIAAPPNLISFD
jgi:hypothetical protein